MAGATRSDTVTRAGVLVRCVVAPRAASEGDGSCWIGDAGRPRRAVRGAGGGRGAGRSGALAGGASSGASGAASTGRGAGAGAMIITGRAGALCTAAAGDRTVRSVSHAAASVAA